MEMSIISTTTVGGILNVECKAPKGHYRVVREDIIDFCDVVEGDYLTLDKAKKIAQTHSSLLDPVHVYNEYGHRVYSARLHFKN